VIGLDCETHLIRRGCLAPPLVCVSLAGEGPLPAWVPPPGPWALHVAPPPAAVAAGVRWCVLLGAPLARDAAGAALREGVTGANIAYDLLVLALHADLPFDAIFAAIADGRVSDGACVDRLRAVAEGETTPDGRLPSASLAALVARHFGVPLAKGSDTRLRYNELDGIPLDRWPEDAVLYAAHDAAWSLAVDRAQREAPPVAPDLPPGRPVSWEREIRAAWALHLCAAWGLRADPGAVSVLTERWETEIAASVAAGQAGGWVRGGGGGAVLPPAGRVAPLERILDLADGPAPGACRTGKGKLSSSVASVRAALALRPAPDLLPADLAEWDAARDALRPIADAGREETLDRAALQAVVERVHAEGGEAAPRTEPSATYPEGQTKTNRATLQRLARKAGSPPTLRAYSAGLASGKARSVWGEALRAATVTPLTSSPSHLVASGRTAWSKPPLQQPPKKGGVRECFVPSPGYLFASVDYGTAELVALAQIHLWLGLDDSMAATLRAGQDLHLRVAAVLLGTTYDDAAARYAAGDADAKDARQLAKPANFGFPGGLGVATFREFAWATYELELLEEVAKALRDGWFRAWPAMRGYFAWINAQLDAGGGSFQAVQFVSGRRRAGCGYCDGANTYFQGLIADVSKDALWRVQREAWTGRTDDGAPSPLEGARPVLLLHDEIVLEAPVDSAPEAADRLAEVMLAAAGDHIPDVPMRAEPALMGRWQKDPTPSRGPDGRLVVTK
jgi:DNA polymerase-1